MLYDSLSNYAQTNDSHTFQFLLSCAAYLEKESMATEGEASQFRQLVYKYLRPSNEDGRSLLEKLRRSNERIVLKLESLYSIEGLEILLFRWSISQSLDDMAKFLWRSADELVQKIDLLFNQTIVISENNRPYTKSLFSNLLVEVAELLSASASEFQTLSKDLKVFYDHLETLPENELKKGELLALHLAFEYKEAPLFTLLDIQQTSAKIFTAIENLESLFSSFLVQLCANCQSLTVSHSLESILEDVRLNIQGARSAPKYLLNDARIMEKRRLHLLAAILFATEKFRTVHSSLCQILSPGSIKLNKGFILSGEIQRTLSATLTSLVDDPLAAHRAIEKLNLYCANKEVSADGLLQAELNLIDPIFNDKVSTRVIEILSGEMQASNILAVKKKTMNRKIKILQVIQSSLSRSIAILLAVSTFSACGVKTTPISEVVDLRPSVPYHGERKRSNQNKTVEPTPQTKSEN